MYAIRSYYATKISQDLCSLGVFLIGRFAVKLIGVVQPRYDQMQGGF